MVSLQQRFAHATQIAEEELTRRTRRIEELEAESVQNQALLTKLRSKNARLQEENRTATARAPATLEAELRQVKAERDEVKRKNKHLLKVILDLANNKVRSCYIA